MYYNRFRDVNIFVVYQIMWFSTGKLWYFSNSFVNNFLINNKRRLNLLDSWYM